MSEILITYKGVVYPWHCDHMGHMNVMWYVGKFDEATWNLFSMIGFTSTFLKEHKRGMAGLEQQISYRKELFPGDVIEITSSVLEVKEKILRFSHEMRKAETGEIAATTLLTAVHLDTTLRKSCPFPAAIKARAEALLQTPQY